jgi:outer membrane protein OmpA-like peptidoglycan-associated protein
MDCVFGGCFFKPKTRIKELTESMGIISRKLFSSLSQLRQFFAVVSFFKFFIQSCLLLLCLAYLSACVSYFKKPDPRPSGAAEGVMVGSLLGATVVTASAGPALAPAGIVAGGIAGGAIGDYLTRHQTLRQVIERQHIQIYRIGDNVRIIVPSDAVFYNRTAVMKQVFEPVLSQLAIFIKRFEEKGTVQVASFTDNHDFEKRNLSLTQEQARVIANALWEEDIEAQLIYGQGFGSEHPIASNGNLYGQSQNRRLEISFRLLTTAS